MTILLTIFLLSLLTALLLTPLAARWGTRLGLVDKPSGRKVHKKPIPRVGGVAIFLAFYIPLSIVLLLRTELVPQIVLKPSLLWLLGGSVLVFLMGVVDDVRGLPPRLKFALQGVAAFMAYLAGVRFSVIALPWDSIVSLGVLSLPLSIFWFLLVVNAINLIDGLDGLAAGVTLFASMTLMALSLLGQNTLMAVGFAGLAGACLGFLRYNFNPASIFMGDGGSYFLGYMLASLSLLGSMKSQATVAILIPFIALGLPLMDTLLAPIRRFFLGQPMFQPDRSHIHHRLLQMGFSHRKAVLVMYSATIFFGLAALLVVNMRDERAGLILVTLAICLIFGIRKLGYLEYLAVDKMIGYFQDVTDEIGLNRDRRTFLSLQIAIGEARDPQELWDRIVDALIPLRIDRAELHFNDQCFGTSLLKKDYFWSPVELPSDRSTCGHSLMAMELPLVDQSKSFGTLSLKKDLIVDPISHYTLRRIEHLRRSVVSKLIALEDEISVKVVTQRSQKVLQNLSTKPVGMKSFIPPAMGPKAP